MQPAAREISTCPVCGGALDETSGGGLGCMVCLLRVGIGGEDDVPQPTLGGLTSPRDEHFGVYEIERHEDGSLYELGRGGMGVTYRAIDTSLERKVALKIIKIGVAGQSADARERFMREARTAAALRHENIATVFQFGIREETGQCFYAMELIEGETLEERVRRAGPLDAHTTIDIAQQVTAALATAEKRGLIHRDLKPANLMFLNTDQPEVVGRDRRARRGRTAQRAVPTVKIIDFGLAKALNAPVDPMSLTRGGFVGTPAFASPEQFENSALDVRSDIYSLGETLWSALTGKTPFGGHSVEEIHHAQQSSALPVEQLKAARVPSRLRSLLESMLALEPAARPGTHDLAARLQRCSAEASSARRTRIALTAAFILILSAAAFLVFRSLRPQNSASNPALPEKSIAVLPFENLSEEKANAFFADGVQDDILTKLAKVADLKVISRTSVMQYRGKQDVRQIGHALGVSHVLEGTVRRFGAKVHVNAQLVDTRTDTHVWAEEYDRDLNEVFAIEAELAQSVANRLRAKVSARENQAIQERPTRDLAAYDLFLQAKEQFIHDYRIDANPVRTREDLFKAVQLLDQALARDPAFFLAHCQLAYAHDLIYFKFDHTEKRLALAETSIGAAVRLQPDSGETHLAQAIHFYWGYLDYDRARGELAKAQHALPNNVQILKFLGLVDRRQGRWDEAIRNFEDAVDLDPRNAIPINDLGDTYLGVHEYGEASAVYNRALALEPRSINFRIRLASIAVEAEANTAPLRAVLNAIEAEGPSSAAEVAEDSFFLALGERDPAAASRALAKIPSEGNVESTFQLPHAWYEGLLAKLRQDAPGAHAAFTAARAEAEKIVRAQSGNVSPLTLLAFIDAELGDKGKAIEEGRAACDMLPPTKDAVDGVFLVTDLAHIYALTGEKDLALKQLEVVSKIPAGPSYGYLRLNPDWDPLRGDPRFEKIVASLAPDREP